MLAFAALSLSFSFSSVSLIFDLIVFVAPFGRIPLRALDPFFSIFHMFNFQAFPNFSLRFGITVLMNFHALGIPFSSMKFVSIVHRFGNRFGSHF